MTVKIVITNLAAKGTEMKFTDLIVCQVKLITKITPQIIL